MNYIDSEKRCPDLMRHLEILSQATRSKCCAAESSAETDRMRPSTICNIFMPSAASDCYNQGRNISDWPLLSYPIFAAAVVALVRGQVE